MTNFCFENGKEKIRLQYLESCTVVLLGNTPPLPNENEK